MTDVNDNTLIQFIGPTKPSESDASVSYFYADACAFDNANQCLRLISSGGGIDDRKLSNSDRVAGLKSMLAQKVRQFAADREWTIITQGEMKKKYAEGFRPKTDNDVLTANDDEIVRQGVIGG